MTINYESRYSRNSQFANARNDLRADLATEQLVLERIAQLPEDNYRDFARESFQYGVGYAHSIATSQLNNEIIVSDEKGEIIIIPEITQAFFDTLPRNRHRDPEEVAEYEQTLARLVAHTYYRHPVKPLHPTIDVYQLDSFVAFIEGYRLITKRRLPLKKEATA